MPRLTISHHMEDFVRGTCLGVIANGTGRYPTSASLPLSKQWEIPVHRLKKGEVPLKTWLPDIRLALSQGDWRNYLGMYIGSSRSVGIFYVVLGTCECHV